MFTEFVPTQEMLAEFLCERGASRSVCLNGSMDMDERQRVQEAVRQRARDYSSPPMPAARA